MRRGKKNGGGRSPAAVLLVLLSCCCLFLAFWNMGLLRERKELRGQIARLESSAGEENAREDGGDGNTESGEEEAPADPQGKARPEDSAGGEDGGEEPVPGGAGAQEAVGEEPVQGVAGAQEAVGEEPAPGEAGAREAVGEEPAQGETGAQEAAPSQTAPAYLTDILDLKAGTVLRKSKPDPGDLSRYFTAEEIREGDAVYERIIGKSYRKNDHVALSDLRYVKVLHYNFEHQIQVGELIVNKNIEKDIREIFRELFEAEYEIESMRLIDDYWTGDGDSSDYASIDVNNTSAFCYREVTGGSKLSNHAYGLAVDLNPRQNPYVKRDSEGNNRWSHENANSYIKRDSGLPHVITHEDLAYRLFSEHGFDWGGDWNNPKDYQHFDKASAR